MTFKTFGTQTVCSVTCTVWSVAQNTSCFWQFECFCHRKHLLHCRYGASVLWDFSVMFGHWCFIYCEFGLCLCISGSDSAVVVILMVWLSFFTGTVLFIWGNFQVVEVDCLNFRRKTGRDTMNIRNHLCVCVCVCVCVKGCLLCSTFPFKEDQSKLFVKSEAWQPWCVTWQKPGHVCVCVWTTGTSQVS